MIPCLRHPFNKYSNSNHFKSKNNNTKASWYIGLQAALYAADPGLILEKLCKTLTNCVIGLFQAFTILSSHVTFTWHDLKAQAN